MFYLRELICLPLANYLPRLPFFDRVRWRIYRLAGLNILGPSKIWGPLTIRPIGHCHNITIGRGTFLNTETRFGVGGEVHIGRNVQIGPRVMFETVQHDVNFTKGKSRNSHSKSIVIEDEVWLGAGVIVIGGVKIGRGSVVAAGAVVVKDVEAGILVAGVPAKFVKSIQECPDNDYK